MPKIVGYKFEDSMLKSMVRANLIETVVKNFSRRINLNFFTLPGTLFSLESELYDHYENKLNLIGVERDAVIFRKAQKIIKAKELPMTLLKMDDEKFWNTYDNEFDFIWLDYCGPFSPKKKKVLSKIVQGEHLKFRRKKNPIVAVTFMDGMDFQCIESLKLSVKSEAFKHGWEGRELTMQARIRGIPNILNDEANKSNKSAVPIRIYMYHDKLENKKKVPMILMIFSIVRKRKKLSRYPLISMKGEMLN